VGETLLFWDGATGGSVKTCTLCSTEMHYYQVVRGIVLCNPCAADFRPIPKKQKREWKRLENDRSGIG
jgi:hypothetical protein